MFNVMAMVIMGIIAASVVVVASVVSYLHKLSKNIKEPLQEINSEILCKGPHTWKKIKLILPEDIPAYKENPEAFKETMEAYNYCCKCGFVSGTTKMLNSVHLDIANRKNLEYEEAIAKEKDFEELKDEYLEQFLANKGFTEKEKTLIKEGYKLFYHFTDELPNLLIKRQILRMAKKWEDEDDGAQ
jgi:hypothetical protein